MNVTTRISGEPEETGETTSRPEWEVCVYRDGKPVYGGICYSRWEAARYAGREYRWNEGRLTVTASGPGWSRTWKAK